MSILITGATSKTATPLIAQLEATNQPYLRTSRRSTQNTVPLDWDDPATYPLAFQHGPIKAIYLIAPTSATPGKVMIPFIEEALKHGVRRFVMLGGGSLQKNPSMWLGDVWTRLAQAKAEQGAVFSVLRPSWFMQNLCAAGWVEGIRNGKLVSAVGDARVPWVDAGDIAAVAFHALTAPEAEVKEVYDVKGEELLSWDEVAAKISTAIWRDVRHVRVSDEENRKRFAAAGLPGFSVHLVVMLEEKCRKGEMDHVHGLEPNDAPAILGRPMVRMGEFLEKNKAAWM